MTAMIPETAITFKGNTACWVLGPWTQDDSPPIRQLDRPCEWCQRHLSSGVWPNCPDCLNGRHTFEIEVECGQCGPTGFVGVGSWPDGSPRAETCDRCSFASEGHRLVTRRVSIVPGMVLRVIDTLLESGYQVEGQRAVFNDPAWPGESFIRNIRGDIESISALPPDAKPGMWAVELNVQQKEQQ